MMEIVANAEKPVKGSHDGMVSLANNSFLWSSSSNILSSVGAAIGGTVSSWK